MKNKKIFRKYLKRNKYFVGLFVVLFIFPIIIGLIYAIPIPQFVAVDSGDLLAYYGTTFGIIGSFITYRHELNKSKKERISELKPAFIVEVKKVEKEEDIFNIEIINRSQQTVTFLYFYDKFISTIINDKYSFKTTFNKTIKETEGINPDYNITMDSEILDNDGFPKYVQLICDDSDGNSWNCYYYKVKDCNKVYYYPRDFEII